MKGNDTLVELCSGARYESLTSSDTLELSENDVSVLFSSDFIIAEAGFRASYSFSDVPEAGNEGSHTRSIYGQRPFTPECTLSSFFVSNNTSIVRDILNCSSLIHFVLAI